MGRETKGHQVARTILGRRSWRVYTEETLTDAECGALEEAASAAPSVRGSRSARALIISGHDEVKALTGALMAGLIGKGNPWLRSAPPAAFGVLIGDSARSAREGERRFYNMDVAIAGELLVLAATQAGLASCWLAAINSDSAARHLGLGDDDRIPAVIALGHGGVRKKGALLAAGWDRITRIAVSKRRKPIEKLCSLERHGSKRSLPATDLSTLPDDGRSLQETIESASPTASFGGKEPSEAELSLVVESMRLAPSADNGQTWRFVVVKGQEQTFDLLKAAGFALPPTSAPAAMLVVSAAPFLVKQVRKEEPFALIDHPIALTHAILVARVLKLRWNLSFIFDYEAVRRWAGIPSSHEITALLALDGSGEPASEPYPDFVQLHH